MSNKISRHEEEESVKGIIYAELREWKPIESFTHKKRQSILLQSEKHPEIGVWTYLRRMSTMLDVNLRTGNEMVQLSAVCVCRSCWPSVEIVAKDVYEKAISKGITHIITRHSDGEFMMYEPNEEVRNLFGWGYDVDLK